MLSVTWNALLQAFGNDETFFDGKTVDDVLLSVHKAQKFVGMSTLKTFSLHDVVHHPDIPLFGERLPPSERSFWHINKSPAAFVAARLFQKKYYC